MLAALFILSPVIAATPTYTLSVATNAHSYTINQTITITGVVSPAPGSGTEVSLFVYNPQNVLVYPTVASVDGTSGDYTATVPSTSVGVGNNWITGTYTVKATWALTGTSTPVTQSATFTFTGKATPVAGTTLEVLTSGSSLVLPGETAAISALVVWNNGTVAPSPVNFTGSWFISPSGAASAAPAPVQAGKGYWWSIPVTSSTADGLYVVELKAAVGSTVAWGQASFTVSSGTSGIASGSAVSSANSSLNALGNQVNTLGNKISANFSKTWTALSSMQTAITNAISSAQTALTTAINGATSAAQTAATDASNAQSDVSTVTTYVLVVAILVAITLVLELAVLVRKLS